MCITQCIRLLQELTFSIKISRRVASGIAEDADIFVQVQCINTTSYSKPKMTMINDFNTAASQLLQ